MKCPAINIPSCEDTISGMYLNRPRHTWDGRKHAKVSAHIVSKFQNLIKGNQERMSGRMKAAKERRTQHARRSGKSS